MSAQVFSVHPHNHRCFLYKGKPFKILTSAEHYGAVLNSDFDYDIYLQEMRRTGQNMTRLFTFYRETAECIPDPGRMNTLAPTTQASVMPWERVSGPGKAADGLDKFDLNRWNSAYFARLKDFVRKCDNQGVVCEIVLFCNPYDQKKYDLFPCSKVSNINGVSLNIDKPQDFLILKDPTLIAFQESFVSKIATELNQFDNVYYEICNEPNLQSGSPEDYDLASLLPAIGLLPQKILGYGYAASVDNQGRYLLYFIDERLYKFEPCEPQALTVPLNLPSGSYSAKTFNPRTGDAIELPRLQSEGTVMLNIPEFREDVAVLLE